MHDEAFEIIMPFKIGKVKKGAIVIQPEGSKDIFDLPLPRLKKLIHGFAWRDEHFSGMALRDISKREKCSEAYVGTAIFESFKFGKAA